MRVPADVYTRSPRVYRGLEELTYPFHDETFTVTHCGRICFKGRKVKPIENPFGPKVLPMCSE
jgi:putative transposase